MNTALLPPPVNEAPRLLLLVREEWRDPRWLKYIQEYLIENTLFCDIASDEEARRVTHALDRFFYERKGGAIAVVGFDSHQENHALRLLTRPPAGATPIVIANSYAGNRLRAELSDWAVDNKKRL